MRNSEHLIRLRIKEVAKEKGISMGKLSRTADVTYRTIKRIYSDPYYSITTTTLDRIAQALGVPSRDLLVDEETPKEGM